MPFSYRVSLRYGFYVSCEAPKYSESASSAVGRTGFLCYSREGQVYTQMTHEALLADHCSAGSPTITLPVLVRAIALGWSSSLGQSKKCISAVLALLLPSVVMVALISAVQSSAHLALSSLGPMMPPSQKALLRLIIQRRYGCHPAPIE